MMNAEKNMTPRLLAIADCVSEGSTIADIGTDHAYIPIYLMQKGIIKKAYAMDINEGPISRAEDNILKFKMDDKIVTRLSDGLKKLELGEADEIVIAGMGGILISEILDARQDLWKNTKFVLQPMTATEELRKYLVKNGFIITKETLAKEDNKIYQIICAELGKMQIEREVDYYISPYLVKNKIKLTEELIKLRIGEFEKMLAGLKASNREETKEKLKYVEMLLDELYDVQKECSK